MNICFFFLRIFIDQNKIENLQVNVHIIFTFIERVNVYIIKCLTRVPRNKKRNDRKGDL